MSLLVAIRRDPQLGVSGSAYQFLIPTPHWVERHVMKSGPVWLPGLWIKPFDSHHIILYRSLMSLFPTFFFFSSPLLTCTENMFLKKKKIHTIQKPVRIYLSLRAKWIQMHIRKKSTYIKGGEYSKNQILHRIKKWIRQSRTGLAYFL